MKKSILASLLATALFGTTAVQAANVVLVNLDPANAGLNDTTTRAPEGGNPGVTVGEQRRIAYQFAASLWGAVLQSSVPIRVGASFQPLTCTATSGVLGSAGPWWINNDFPNAPLPGTLYHAALANSLAGTNLNAADPTYVAPDDIEINSRFNANLGSTGCLQTSGWYYGLDGNTPANKIAFLDVVMHEIGHGLGFSGFINKTTGNFDYGLPDVYSTYAYDNQTNRTFVDPTMDNATRATTMKTPGRLVWSGATVTAQAPGFLAPGLALRVTSPAAVARDYEYGSAGFGPAATPSNYNGQLVQGVPTNGCTAITSDVVGKIALISRGTCPFAVKTKNAQNAGAVAVLIANNAAGAPGLGGTDATITIPTLSVSQSDGAALAANLPAAIGLVSAPGLLQGGDSAGRVRLYAPVVVAGGSTFSHYDDKLTPNALMEPAINDSLAANYDLDLTPALFKDLAWGETSGTAKLGTCDTTVLVQNHGLVAGANVLAQDALCKAGANHVRANYLRCMNDHAVQMQQAGVINVSQLSKVRTCASTVTP